MTDQQLMQAIKSKWGEDISAAVSASSLPASFLAALIANESGGNDQATRYEPAVFSRLAAKYPEWGIERLTANAKSWGLTQIMGENYPGPPAELAQVTINLPFAVKMLAAFADRFELDLTADFEELFRCWNTGQPDRPTYDPNYCALGLTRKTLYEKM